MPLQVWRMLQKPLCGNQMNLATLTINENRTYLLNLPPPPPPKKTKQTNEQTKTSNTLQ